MSTSGEYASLFAARRRLVLHRGKERATANRHPWVFSGAIATDEGPPDAAVADLHAADGRRIASGFYSGASQIRMRALAFDEELSPALIESRIHSAIAARTGLLTGETSAVRLINSEGDHLSGLVVDLYDDVCVVEITSAGLDRVRGLVLEAVRATINPRLIVLRNDLPARRLERLPLEDAYLGSEESDVIVREHGLRFRVPLRDGQKTGFFLDQRDNRALVRAMAGGREVLDVFCYSGGFGVNAVAGGAISVAEVDASEPAIGLARHNHELNGTPESAVSFTAVDAFRYLRDLGRAGRAYDLIVCDPPAFAKSRGEVERAARGYKDINLQSFRLAKPGALVLTFSCSGHVSLDLFQKIVFAAALDAKREVSILQRLGAGADHPVSIYCPEGEYLKGFLLRVDR